MRKGPAAARPASRGRLGRPPTIGRDDIVAAAARLDGPFTMRAVADELGVTASALYHHVSDVRELRILVAAAQMLELDELPDLPWPEQLRFAGAQFRDALLELSELPDVSPLSASSARWALHLTDSLIDAGLDGEAATRTAHQLVSTVWVNVKDRRQAGVVDGNHPQMDQLLEVLAEAGPEVQQRLEQMADHDARLAFDIESIVLATSARLA